MREKSTKEKDDIDYHQNIAKKGYIKAQKQAGAGLIEMNAIIKYAQSGRDPNHLWLKENRMLAGKSTVFKLKRKKAA